MQSEANHSQPEYLKRLHAVLDFIEQHLDADLSLSRLSAVAHYSPFHFHRLFSTLIGETLNDYINRKRIERIASILLVGTDESIKALAYRYGFNSESSFSRSFRKYYGTSPTNFKIEGKAILSKIGIASFSMEKYICRIDHLKKWMEMNAQIEIKELPAIKLAGIMRMGQFEEVGQLYQKLMQWGAEKGVLDKSNFKAITLYHDNPHVTHLSKVRYSACVTTNKSMAAEGEIRPLTIEKGIYAVGRFEMHPADFPQAWDSMNAWVIETGYIFRDGDYFEVYLNDHKTHPEQKFIVDICLPLENNEKVKRALSQKASNQGNLSHYRAQITQGQTPIEYDQLISFIKGLRTYFRKVYAPVFIIGRLYQGNMDFSYISLTTQALKKQKLKFVIIFNHQLMRFEICLSGQNKAIRKKYWQLFKGSDWHKYHLAESIDDSLSIIDHIIVRHPNFAQPEELTEQIEKEALQFINDLRAVLE